MMEFRFTLSDEAATDRLGAVLAELLPDRTVVALVGPLGSGKTRLVQAVASAVGIPREDVTSPTFVVCQEYHGLRSIYHFDAFRIANEDEFRDLGPEEYFDEPALVFIEWADRIRNCLPEERLEIRIDPGVKKRQVILIPAGTEMESIANRVAEHMQ
ncbi:MAG: tRNA (adenosine(37)-N6)-threonylcarbamoyltransferase complex ATPase subunit type 1 TsaE [Pirellulales bacterium]|nr:tRNA (adenosine(37)-N6)-threonylcarbamoyltransferase complex ATPase subunit type 1 TsaE [Pirellulales bacterium]